MRAEQVLKRWLRPLPVGNVIIMRRARHVFDDASSRHTGDHYLIINYSVLQPLFYKKSEKQCLHYLNKIKKGKKIA